MVRVLLDCTYAGCEVPSGCNCVCTFLQVQCTNRIEIFVQLKLQATCTCELRGICVCTMLKWQHDKDVRYTIRKHATK